MENTKKEKIQSADEGGSSSVPGAGISGSGTGGGEDAGGGEVTEVGETGACWLIFYTPALQANTFM